MSLICQPQMLDPLTVVNSYLANPSPLRLTCRFMVGSYAHSVYLETEQHVPYVASRSSTDSGDSRNFFPVQWDRLAKAAPGSLPSGSQVCLVDLHNLEKLDTAVLPFMDSETSKSWFDEERQSLSPTLRPMLEVHLARMPNLQKIGGMKWVEKSRGILVQTDVRSLVGRPDVTALIVKDLPLLETIGTHWGSNLGIQTLTFNHLPKLTEIGNSFSHGCRALETVEFGPDLPKLAKVGGHFFSHCRQLKSFSLIGLQQVETIGHAFLQKCDTLVECFLEDLPTLVELGNMCLGLCGALKTISLRNLPKLKKLSMFADDCGSLQTATFKDLPVLTFVHQSVMSTSEGASVTFSNVPCVRYSGYEPWAQNVQLEGDPACYPTNDRRHQEVEM